MKCINCGMKCHPPDHQWGLLDTREMSYLCNLGVAVLEKVEGGVIAWCARCWTFQANKIEELAIVAERRDAVANGRHWV